MEARLLVSTRTPHAPFVQVLEHGVAAALDHEVRRFHHRFLFRAAELLHDGVEHVPARLPVVREIGDEAEVAAFVGLVGLTVRLARGAQLLDQGGVALVRQHELRGLGVRCSGRARARWRGANSNRRRSSPAPSSRSARRLRGRSRGSCSGRRGRSNRWRCCGRRSARSRRR